MQSPGHQDYYHQENDKQRQDDSPTRTNEEQQARLADESSSTLIAVKNKKRVHYPQSNGEHLTQDTSKTDCLKSDPDSSTLGKRRSPHRPDVHSLHSSRSVFQNKQRFYTQWSCDSHRETGVCHVLLFTIEVGASSIRSLSQSMAWIHRLSIVMELGHSRRLVSHLFDRWSFNVRLSDSLRCFTSRISRQRFITDRSGAFDDECCSVSVGPGRFDRYHPIRLSKDRDARWFDHFLIVTSYFVCDSSWNTLCNDGNLLCIWKLVSSGCYCCCRDGTFRSQTIIRIWCYNQW